MNQVAIAFDDIILDYFGSPVILCAVANYDIYRCLADISQDSRLNGPGCQ